MKSICVPSRKYIAGTFVRMRVRAGAIFAILVIILNLIWGFRLLTSGQPNTFMQIVLVSWIAFDCVAFVMVALSWNDLDRPC